MEKKEIEKLSADIEILESEKRKIEEEMSSGRLNPDEIYALSVRHGEIKQSLDDKELRWLELSEK